MKKVFMVMPFGDAIANSVYKLCIKPVCEEYGLTASRADELFTTNPILEDIVSAIQEATVIIVDISGKNPNVFYELGIAHTLKQSQTIMITHEGYVNTPFDIAHFRILKYEDTISGKVEFENQLKRTLENIMRDYKTIFREEFDLLYTFLKNTEPYVFYNVIGLAKSTRPIKRLEPLEVEGHYEKNRYGSKSLNLEEEFQQYIKLGYVQVIGEYISTTEKGKAFAEILEEKGYICDYFNGQTFTEGYVSQLTNESGKNE